MKVHLVYFSPNGTTRKSLRNITESLVGLEVIEHDLLSPASRKTKYNFTNDDLVILGLPTAGMLYGKVSEVFNCIEGSNTPMVGVALYGNGYYGVALTEMKQKAESKGFIMCAMGVFIGQHSIRNQVAAGRPDDKDKAIQVDFGKKVYEKVVIKKDFRLYQELKVGWSSSEKFNEIISHRLVCPDEYSLPLSLKTKEISMSCIQCNTCVKHCPTNAINIEEKSFDLESCIGCNACINRCPKRAITMTNDYMNQINDDFALQFQTRLEPEIFM